LCCKAVGHLRGVPALLFRLKRIALHAPSSPQQCQATTASAPAFMGDDAWGFDLAAWEAWEDQWRLYGLLYCRANTLLLINAIMLRAARHNALARCLGRGRGVARCSCRMYRLGNILRCSEKQCFFTFYLSSPSMILLTCFLSCF